MCRKKETPASILAFSTRAQTVKAKPLNDSQVWLVLIVSTNTDCDLNHCLVWHTHHSVGLKAAQNRDIHCGACAACAEALYAQYFIHFLGFPNMQLETQLGASSACTGATFGLDIRCSWLQQLVSKRVRMGTKHVNGQNSSMCTTQRHAPGIRHCAKRNFCDRIEIHRPRHSVSHDDCRSNRLATTTVFCVRDGRSVHFIGTG